jgi:hypothetical protein
MTAGCSPGHAWVVAGGNCAGCGLPVQASGPLGDAGEPGWLAPPFADPATSAACRHNDGGPHAPAHAFGTCTSCSTTVEATTAGPGQTAWFE